MNERMNNRIRQRRRPSARRRRSGRLRRCRCRGRRRAPEDFPDRRTCNRRYGNP